MKKIIIVGAGVAGLTAGIFGQLNGFSTTLIEKNSLAGGECMGWNRKGFHIDGCIHWLVGTKEGTDINDLWKTVGALDGVDIYHPQEFMVFHHEGIAINLHRDIEVLKEEWLKLSPEDEACIVEFCDDVTKIQSFDVPAGKPIDLMKLKEKISFILSMKDAGMIMRKYGKMDLKTYASRYKHPAIREMFANFLPGGYRASSLFFGLAMFMKGQASLPRGGSFEFSNRMKNRYLELGGNLSLKTEVKVINIEGNKATGVTLKDNTFIEADYVLAACDAHHVFNSLLNNNYQDRAFTKRFNNKELYPLASQIQVSLSVDTTMDNFPRTQSFAVEPIKLMNQSIDRLAITHFSYEPSFAPMGKTIITVAINQFEKDVKDWFELHKDKEKYQNTKENLGNKVASCIEAAIPELKEKVNLLDVTTPITYSRYCNAYQGSFMAFLPTIKGKGMSHTGKIKGLENVFITGQWLQPPGGLPVALLTGKDSIMRLCIKENKSFINNRQM